MKLFLVALCVVCTVAIASGQSVQGRGPLQHNLNRPSEEERRAEERVRRCQEQEQATDNDMREFSQQSKPSTKTGKCLHACLMESIGLIENGKLSTENSVRFMSHMARGNSELTAIIEEISKECENIQNEDRCEMAFQIMTCTEDGVKKRQDVLRKFMPRQQQHQPSQ